MKHTIRRSAGVVRAFVSGVGVGVETFMAPVFKHRRSGSDLQYMRGDVLRVGKTMHEVICRENEQKNRR